MPDHGFLHQALIYLAAGVVAVPLFQRLGLGAVLGYLVAGVVIGPGGVALVSDPAAVLQFAELGVVLLLFLVGLELNPSRIWQLRHTIIGLGSAQVAVTVAAIAGIGWAIGVPPVVALVAGMGFAMTSTAIALATLQERGLLATAGGRAGVSVSIFQDISVIPLMLLLAFLQPDAADRGLDWRAGALAVAAIGLVIVLGRLLLRPALRFIANTRLREVFVAFSLLLVIGIAALMVEIGLSMAFGAFLAGVLLADSEYRHELELDIEPFKGLLLGLFFIAIGMSVDLSLFQREPLLVLGLAAAVVALKALLVYPVAIAFGYRARTDALVLALAIAQVGEFAFILFGAAGALLPGETRDLLNAVVAVTMLSAPLVMMGYDRLLAPRLAGQAPAEADRIDERNPVIVAGFGRFGQVLARVLAGLKIRATLIDHDPNQVDLVRRFGNKAYYGDATRMDVLESAGIAGARLLVLALDDPEATRRLAERVRARYPELKLIVRAHGRSDAFEYAEMGVPAVRETFGSALIAAEAALRALDFGPLAARRVVSKFRRVDEEALLEQAAHREDVKKLISLTQQGREDLERLLNEEALR